MLVSCCTYHAAHTVAGLGRRVTLCVCGVHTPRGLLRHASGHGQVPGRETGHALDCVRCVSNFFLPCILCLYVYPLPYFPLLPRSVRPALPLLSPRAQTVFSALLPPCPPVCLSICLSVCPSPSASAPRWCSVHTSRYGMQPSGVTTRVTQ